MARRLSVSFSGEHSTEASNTRSPMLPHLSSSQPSRSQPRSSQLLKTGTFSIIKSNPYTLEDFAKHFQLPQTVRVYAGHYGLTEQLSMSEGEELILFFIKSSKVVKATTRNKSETYYLPLNSLLQFSPYYQTTADSNAETACHQYTTVSDLIQRKEGLPKVVKVLKSYSGTSERSSVQEGEIIFPKKISGKGRNTVLKCINRSGNRLKLGLSCMGQFSTDPYDVRMYLSEYIEHINEFPAPLLIFSENEHSKKLLQVYSSTLLVLEAPQSLRSYICSTNITGESDYPMIELPMFLPIQIQCAVRPGLNMEPIYNKVQHIYENFKQSIVKTSIYPAQSQKSLKIQQQFYEEVQKDDGSSHFYDLERPEAIYEPIPGEIDVAQPLLQNNHQTQYMPLFPNMHPLSSKYSSLTDQDKPLTVPVTSPDAAQPLLQNNHQTQYMPLLPNIHPLSSPYSSLTDHYSNKPAIPVTSPDPPIDTITSPTPEENIAYLRTMDVDRILQLLVDMNLGQYKESFQHEQVDGELLADLTVEELEDLGVTKKIHQRRLMKLIDGSSSAKKYEGGMYGTLS
ncbi:uncharacterized protein [Dysidea avara]|uniref:uncharacterized protein n=1 Tax=Dysidea avara TaxID=196820 RepID=UPI00332553CA